ncbi:GH-E family nuclease [Nocardia sp. BMG51109]|uniref:WXG100-like domain-containing protein n=1 Tax=Nocardia sp. BMG51109 TaxID=1056816 RepID=UPI0004B9581D|nr:GH-E family nuclease [Nocardia sp. BMG51109]
MTAPIVVDPDGFTQAAEVYAQIHRNSLVPAITELSSALAGCGGSAGSDNAGLKWSADYDPAAYSTVDALGDLALAVGQMHDLLQATSSNHRNANTQSAPDANPAALVFPPGSLPVYNPPEPPPTFGGDDPEPTGWDWVKGAVQGELWPNGRPSKLRTAAGAWRSMATKLRMATLGLPGARQLIESQQTPETQQALEQADLVKNQFDTLAGACDALASSCDAYADSVSHTKGQIVEALIELAAIVAVDQAAGWIGAALTGGGSAVAAQGGMALAISIYGARIAAMIRALVGLTEAARVPVAVSQAVSRGTEALIPLLRARPALAGAEGAVAPGPFTSFSSLYRPKLTQQTKDTIEAGTKKWGPPGKEPEFYEVKSEPDIKVPINRSYDDNPWVTQLPKSEDGKYYVDAANEVRYPVNPKWEYGHNSGFEHRKLLAEAQDQNMTQQQFNDHVNRHPDYFHVEDFPGNRDHHREEK